MNNNYALGLDIGITSCGYGVIDLNSRKFVDYGVRLFKQGTPENNNYTRTSNEDRRNSRGRRRLISRRNTRLSDMKELLKENGIMSEDYKPLSNVYEIRCKGLTKKLTNDELTAAILHITKHRGSVVETVEEDAEKSAESEGLKATLQRNEQLVHSGKFICQIQLERLKDENKVRNHKNNFSTKDYLDELKEILDHQDLSIELKKSIDEIVSRRRKYYEGPGSAKSPTPYGRFIEVDGHIEVIDLIEKMRGKCSVYPDQLRAPKMAVSADIYNFLNDLNNLTVEGNKLKTDDKEHILTLISNKGSITLRQLAKELGVSEFEIKGYRINKSGKAIFTEFKGYKKIKAILEKEGKNVTLKDYEMLDKIIEILTNKKGIEERKYDLATADIGLDDSMIETLANTTGITGYHSLSFKAIYMFNKELYYTEMNQMQILHSMLLDNSMLLDKSRGSTKGKKNIEADAEAILSPVARRAQNETIKVVNSLRKKYGEFDSIVIEMTRDKNSDEQKKRINQYQKKNENSSKEMNEFLKDAGFDPEKINGKTRMKIRLYLQQDGKSAYTFQPIDLGRLIKDPTYTEIDHIIPISISLDDSQNNKVLALHSENQMKENLTPFMAFSAGKFNGMGCTYSEFKTNVLANSNIPYRKKLNLLNEKDITKIEVIKEFINRNLVDTSYACRTVLNTLQDYFKDNEIDTKVHTVNGRLTDLFRKRIHLPKDREEDYLHHAIDGLIVASVKKLNLLNGYLAKNEFSDLYNETTGEITTIPDDKQFYDESYIMYILQLKTIYEESNKYYNHLIDKESMMFKPIKVSHKIDSKPNRRVADDTIYSTRKYDDTDYLIEKISNIYDPKDKKCKRLVEDVLNGADDKYLMAKHDPQTFKLIQDIIKYHYEQYKEDGKTYKVNEKKEIKLSGDNPLALYKEENGYIHKYSKKGNGPAIVSMKYQSDQLGNHLDITKNYDAKDKKVILKKISPYRTDFYKCEDGKFRFVTVRYINVKYKRSIEKFTICKDWYEKEKEKKGIKPQDEFLFSMHRDELISIVKKDGDKYIYDSSTESNGETIYHDGIHPEIFKFTATNDDNANIIEIKPIYTYCKKQLKLGVLSLVDIKKYATDVLGNLYEVKDNKLKLEFD